MKLYHWLLHRRATFRSTPSNRIFPLFSHLFRTCCTPLDIAIHHGASNFRDVFALTWIMAAMAGLVLLGLFRVFVSLRSLTAWGAARPSDPHTFLHNLQNSRIAQFPRVGQDTSRLICWSHLARIVFVHVSILTWNKRSVNTNMTEEHETNTQQSV